MNIQHSHFGINTNTEALSSQFLQLNREYGKIPGTTCMFCPGCDTVVAQCCKSFNPKITLLEFFNILRQVSTWPREEQDQLAINCFESYLNIEIEVGCSLLGQDNRCRVYLHRGLGCRLYGQYSNKVWNEIVTHVSKETGLPENKLPMGGETVS